MGRRDGRRASPDSFTEAGLRTGTEYYYRITTCYRTPDGLRRYSPGRRHAGGPPNPRSWRSRTCASPGRTTAPRLGGHLDAATVRSGAAGARRRAAALAPRHPHLAGRHGRAAGCSRRTAPRHRRPRCPRTAPAARTSSHPGPDRRPQRVGGRPYGGSPHGRICPGADRRQDQRSGAVGWIWPRWRHRCPDQLARWRAALLTGVYDDEGGAVITVGAAEATIEVGAVLSAARRQPHRPGYPGARACAGRGRHLPDQGQPVAPAPADYRVRRRASDPAAGSRVVRSTAGTLPTTRPRARWWPGSAAGHHARPDRGLPGPGGEGAGLAACFVDPDTPEADAREVLIFPPPTKEMRIR